MAHVPLIGSGRPYSGAMLSTPSAAALASSAAAWLSILPVSAYEVAMKQFSALWCSIRSTSAVVYSRQLTAPALRAAT